MVKPKNGPYTKRKSRFAIIIFAIIGSIFLGGIAGMLTAYFKSAPSLDQG